MYRTALIVAGGKGLRMGSELPKQFLPIGGKPVLMHTLEAFHRFDKRMQLILVLPREQQGFGGNCVKRMDLTSGMKLPMEVKPVSTRLKTDWL